MPALLLHASALVAGSAVYFYLFTVLTTQPRKGWAGRLLLALVFTSGVWYLGNLVAVYLQLGTWREQRAGMTVALLLANAGGWAAWPIGAGVAWHALRLNERRFFVALMACAVVSAFASLKYPFGSLPTVLGTLPVPLAIFWFLMRDQIFGFYLPRRAILAAVFGGFTAGYVLLVQPLARWVEGWLGAVPDVTQIALLFAGAIAFIPLYYGLLERETRRILRKRDRIRLIIRAAARVFDPAERIRLIENSTREAFGFRNVRIAVDGAADDASFTHSWVLESEGRPLGRLLVDAGTRRRLDEDEAVMEMMAHEVAYSLSTLRLLEDKIGLERELLNQEHLASLGKVAAAIAHEIKNPLSAIKTITSLMLEDPRVAGACETDLRYIRSEMDRLASSVNQLLGFARPLEEIRTLVDLSELVLSRIEVFARHAAAEGVRVEATVEPGWKLPQGNPELVSQILTNLTLNAIQVAPKGSVVGVSLHGSGPEVELAIADAGPGIPPELRDRVFDPFFTTRQQGTGLGLAIVRKAVHNLGGEISFESLVGDGHGTRFAVRLPGAVREARESA
jgi:signal transduction histidine kinase